MFQEEHGTQMFQEEHGTLVLQINYIMPRTLVRAFYKVNKIKGGHSMKIKRMGNFQGKQSNTTTKKSFFPYKSLEGMLHLQASEDYCQMHIKL